MFAISDNQLAAGGFLVILLVSLGLIAIVLKTIENRKVPVSGSVEAQQAVAFSCGFTAGFKSITERQHTTPQQYLIPDYCLEYQRNAVRHGFTGVGP